MFDTFEEGKPSIVSNKQIDFVKAEFTGVDTLTWEELFQGYDRLSAITYSSGISFVCKLLTYFKDAEIIFGFEDVMTYTMQEIVAYQSKTIERLRESASKSKLDLITRIDDGSLKLRVARGQLSHEKIYLLEADDGRKRVVMGSANMSYAAFSGSQRENICYMDGDRAFDWYFGCYKRLKENSTGEIPLNALATDTDLENIEELPISHEVKVLKALVIEPRTDAETIEDVRFSLDAKNMAVKYAPLMPKADKKSGKIKLSPEIIKQTRRIIEDAAVQEKKERDEYPQLVVNIDDQTVALNDKTLDLNPSAEDVAKDVELFLEYMNGFDKFHGNPNMAMQMRYFEFANWFFATPFMASIRFAASINNQANLLYPIFGLVIGRSKAGKTTFLETLLKMMIGQKPIIEARQFTRTAIDGLRRTVKGAPIIVDDLTSDRFRQHAIETIKNDTFGVAEKLLHYPAVVISANEDVKVVAPEIARRTIVCRVSGSLKTTDMITNNTVRRIQGNIGTAFYREYLRHMLKAIPDLINELREPDSAAPDVLAISSRVICSMLRKYNSSSLPPYARKLKLDDYFSERITGAHVIKEIRQNWQIDRDAFKVDRRANQLSYNAKEVYAADRLLKELPEDLEAHKSREWVIMDLDKACEFFGINFRKIQLFGKFLGI